MEKKRIEGVLKLAGTPVPGESGRCAEEGADQGDFTEVDMFRISDCTVQTGIFVRIV